MAEDWARPVVHWEIYAKEASEYEWLRKLGLGEHGNIHLAYCISLL